MVQVFRPCFCHEEWMQRVVVIANYQRRNFECLDLLPISDGTVSRDTDEPLASFDRQRFF